MEFKVYSYMESVKKKTEIGKILHIATDEKWVSKAYSIFEQAYAGCNEVLILSESDKLKYVNDIPYTILKQNEINEFRQSEIFRNVKIVFLHSIDLGFYKIRFPHNVKVIWIGFGFDYYDLIYENDDDLLLEKTKELKLIKGKSHILKNFKIFLMRSFFYRVMKKRISKKAFIKNLDYFIPVLSSEYILIKENYNGIFPELLDWNYGTLENDYSINISVPNGSNVLVGNSATYTNNHLELFDIVKSANLNKENKIICPLSYGDSEYAQHIKKYGEDMFKEQFEAVTGFMDKTKYISLLSSCNVAIFNHVRQQAVGNILIMLYLGAKVYVRRDNPVYAFFIEKGVNIFLIEEIQNEGKIENDLSFDQIEKNKELLKGLYSNNAMLYKTKKMISYVLSKS